MSLTVRATTAASLFAALCFTFVSGATLTQSAIHPVSRVALPTKYARSSRVLMDSLVGVYENLKYSGAAKNNWHYVTLTKKSETELTWTNRAGRSWTLTLIAKGDGYDATQLSVGTDSPYYSRGHTIATVKWNSDMNAVTALLGPYQEAYTRLCSATDVTKSVTGLYENMRYSGAKKNNWHYVTVASVNDTTVKWTNRAGVEWTLDVQEKLSGYSCTELTAAATNPYFARGYTKTAIQRSPANNAVTAITGPYSEPYHRWYTSSEVVSGLVGTYENFRYVTGSGKNKWHFVELTKVSDTEMKWTNRAGVSWKLNLISATVGYKADVVSVTGSPYASRGHTSASLVWDHTHTEVIAITGPWGEYYTRV